ncbi:hypothetical protein U1Q18_051068 [Sarracenia purpurea var. burkii]
MPRKPRCASAQAKERLQLVIKLSKRKISLAEYINEMSSLGASGSANQGNGEKEIPPINPHPQNEHGKSEHSDQGKEKTPEIENADDLSSKQKTPQDVVNEEFNLNNTNSNSKSLLNPGGTNKEQSETEDEYDDILILSDNEEANDDDDHQMLLSMKEYAKTLKRKAAQAILNNQIRIEKAKAIAIEAREIALKATNMAKDAKEATLENKKSIEANTAKNKRFQRELVEMRKLSLEQMEIAEKPSRSHANGNGGCSKTSYTEKYGVGEFRKQDIVFDDENVYFPHLFIEKFETASPDDEKFIEPRTKCKWFRGLITAKGGKAWVEDNNRVTDFAELKKSFLQEYWCDESQKRAFDAFKDFTVRGDEETRNVIRHIMRWVDTLSQTTNPDKEKIIHTAYDKLDSDEKFLIGAEDKTSLEKFITKLHQLTKIKPELKQPKKIRQKVSKTGEPAPYARKSSNNYEKSYNTTNPYDKSKKPFYDKSKKPFIQKGKDGDKIPTETKESSKSDSRDDSKKEKKNPFIKPKAKTVDPTDVRILDDVQSTSDSEEESSNESETSGVDSGNERSGE